MNIQQTQQELIETFDFFDNWLDKYQYIIDLGKKLPEFPKEWQDDAHKLHGCQSQVWLHTEFSDNQLHFQATSDSAIVTGLIALMLQIYNHRTPQEILTTSPAFIREIGLDKHLSINRSNGLHAMLKAVRYRAEYYQNVSHS